MGERTWSLSEIAEAVADAHAAEPARRPELFAGMNSSPPNNLASQAVQDAYRRAIQTVGALPMA